MPNIVPCLHLGAVPTTSLILPLYRTGHRRSPVQDPVRPVNLISYKPQPQIMRMRMRARATANHERTDSNSRVGSDGNYINKAGQLLLSALVSAATEFIRFFSSITNTHSHSEQNVDHKLESSSITSTPNGSSTLQQVLKTLEFDYQNAYFLTGVFSKSLYAEDCYFADPTISFTGTDLYERNLKLLIPFLDEPSLILLSLQQQIAEDKVDEEQNVGPSIKATWRLRTYLKFPWRPLIHLDGSTRYTLDENFLIVKHTESWSISPFNAIGQIFRRGNAQY